MATLELILVIPILLIVLVVSFQFGIVAIYQAAVTHSATVAAREAGKCADFDTVGNVVQSIVDVHGITISDASGSGTKVTMDKWCGFDEDDNPLPPIVESYGDPSLSCPPPSNDPQFREIRVTVCIDLAATRFCDALAPWGLTFAGRTFRASSLVTGELAQDAP